MKTKLLETQKDKENETPGTFYKFQRQSSVNGSSAKVCTKVTIESSGKKTSCRSRIVEVPVNTKKMGPIVKRTLYRKRAAHGKYLEELSRNEQDTKNSVLFASINSLNQANAAKVLKGNKALDCISKLSVEKSTDIQLGSNVGDAPLRKIRTGIFKANKEESDKVIVNPFQSDYKIRAERKKRTPFITKENFDLLEKPLFKNKIGENKNKTHPLPVVQAKDVLKFTLNMIKTEEKSLVFYPHKDTGKLRICITLDGGNQSIKTCLCLMDIAADQDVILNIFSLYRGAECRENLSSTLSRYRRSFKEMHGKKVVVNGKEREIELFGLFDISAQGDLLGTAKSSATEPDIHTDVKASHLKNHAGTPHSITDCGEDCGSWRSMSSLKRCLTASMNYSAGDLDHMRKNSKHFGSVKTPIILELSSIFHYPSPPMHVIDLGLANDVTELQFEETRKCDKENLTEDEKEAYERNLEGHKIELAKLDDHIEELDKNIMNVAEEHAMIHNEYDKLTAIIEKNIKNAENLAKFSYSKPPKIGKNAKKTNCDAIICLSFPVDIKAGNLQISCKNGCLVCHRCEGLTSSIVQDEEEYECLKCQGKTPEDIKEIFLDKAEILYDIYTNSMHDKSSTMLKRDEVEGYIANEGYLENKMKDSMKKMGIETCIYHGGKKMEGSMVGKIYKDIEETRKREENGEDSTYTILECWQNDPVNYARFKEIWDIIYDASTAIKTMDGSKEYSDEEIEHICELCGMFGKRFPVLFSKGITPKGHSLSITIPHLIRKFREYRIFYKIEQKSEKLHAELNKIEARLLSVRQLPERYLMMIKQYDCKNRSDRTICVPEKRNLKRNVERPLNLEEPPVQRVRYDKEVEDVNEEYYEDIEEVDDGRIQEQEYDETQIENINNMEEGPEQNGSGPEKSGRRQIRLSTNLTDQQIVDFLELFD